MKLSKASFIDIALNFISKEIEHETNLPQYFFENVRRMFEDLFSGLPVHEEISVYLMQTIHTLQPLLKVYNLLAMNENTYTKSFKQERAKRPWSHVEDNRLLAAVNKLGISDWEAIAKFVGNGRSRPQCSQRWKRALDPRISREPWTKAEEQKLIDLVHEYGPKGWGRISMLMGRRSDLQCRYRYEQIRKKQREECKKDVSYSFSSFPHLNKITEFHPRNNKNSLIPNKKLIEDITPKQISVQEIHSINNNSKHIKLESISCLLSKPELESLRINFKFKNYISIKEM